MGRKWTKTERAAQSRRISKYWDRVRRIADVEKISLDRARSFYSRGLFRGVKEDASKRVADTYRPRKVKGKLIIERKRPSGRVDIVPPERVDRAIAQSVYEEMVRRLRIHTGWTRKEVRAYLAQYPQWRDGVSPLYREVR